MVKRERTQVFTYKLSLVVGENSNNGGREGTSKMFSPHRGKRLVVKGMSSRDYKVVVRETPTTTILARAQKDQKADKCSQHQ